MQGPWCVGRGAMGKRGGVLSYKISTKCVQKNEVRAEDKGKGGRDSGGSHEVYVVLRRTPDTLRLPASKPKGVFICQAAKK